MCAMTFNPFWFSQFVLLFFQILLLIFTGGIYESMTIENVYRVVMKLVVRPEDFSDYGAYRCIANNTIGEAEKIVHLHRKFNLLNIKNLIVIFYHISL